MIAQGVGHPPSHPKKTFFFFLVQGGMIFAAASVPPLQANLS